MKRDRDGIWKETENPAYSAVLRKPNAIQTRQQFLGSWVISLLSHGNAYILKVRDNRNVVQRLYVLDASKVKVMASPDGSLVYELAEDHLAGVKAPIMVPSTEIIHDRVNCLFSPAIGLSPLVACALPALQATELMRDSIHRHQNHARPGGVLTSPGAVSDETVQQLRQYWETNYSGNNAGKVAVLADGLKYESFAAMDAASSQVIEQLKWSAENIAAVFHVPAFKLGLGPAPAQSISALNQEYLNTCLMSRLENIEALLDEGLGLATDLRTEFDTSALLRLDPLGQAESLSKLGRILTLNEARKSLDQPAIEGGDTVYLQHQDYSIQAINRRDSGPDPFGNGGGKDASPDVEKSIEIIRKLEGIRHAA